RRVIHRRDVDRIAGLSRDHSRVGPHTAKGLHRLDQLVAETSRDQVAAAGRGNGLRPLPLGIRPGLPAIAVAQDVAELGVEALMAVAHPVQPGLAVLIGSRRVNLLLEYLAGLIQRRTPLGDLLQLLPTPVTFTVLLRK